jgi:hypothetical protein
MARKLLKTWYQTDDPQLIAVARGLNELGLWANTFGSGPPIITHPVPGGVYLHWEPWESPFAHPWRVTLQEGISKVDVAGGRVNTGAASIDVAGLTDLTAVDDLKIWLSVKHYYNTATASEYKLDSGTAAFPSNSHGASYMLVIMPVAEIVIETLYQYLYEDQFIPRIPPPPPDLTKTYYLRCAAGVIGWYEAGAC